MTALTAVPEIVVHAATELRDIGSSVNTANAMATTQTTTIVAAAHTGRGCIGHPHSPCNPQVQTG
ncbi:PE family protein [Mycobacterium ulcerans]|uniref:PE family protein n=1 Tax=Mycobacterium ulcerans TaxID=1809 RepID=UPI00214D05CF